MPNRISEKAAIVACLVLSLTACASTQQHDALQKRVELLSIENDTLRAQQATLLFNQQRQQEQARIQASRLNTLEQFREPQDLDTYRRERYVDSRVTVAAPGEKALTKVVDTAISVLPYLLRPAFIVLGAAARYGNAANGFK